MMRRGALRPSTTGAGSTTAAAGAGARASMWHARSMRRRWWPGSAARTSAWASTSAARPSAGCRWRRARSTARRTTSPTSMCATSTARMSAGMARTAHERTVPTGPIMYTNQGVAGGVTVVPQGVMQARQPITNRASCRWTTAMSPRWQGARNARGAGRRAAPPCRRRPPAAARGGGAGRRRARRARAPCAPRALGATARASAAAQGDGGQSSRGDRVPVGRAAPWRRRPPGLRGRRRLCAPAPQGAPRRAAADAGAA